MLPELTLTACKLCGAAPATNNLRLSEPLATAFGPVAYWVSCPVCGFTTFPRVTPLGAISAWENWQKVLGPDLMPMLR